MNLYFYISLYMDLGYLVDYVFFSGIISFNVDGVIIY